MRFARVRSGLAESFDEVAVVALDPTGAEVMASGDIDRPMYYRSALKPFQALAAQRAGLDLPAEHLALSCSSHNGWPVHIASVRAMLANHGLTEADLQTTPTRPDGAGADAALRSRHDTTERPVLNTCSGKHAAWLAACVTAGWDTGSYLDPDHPLQRSIIEIVRDFTGVEPTPVGVDGCGAPTLVGSVRGLARAFHALDAVDELKPIKTAMTRFGSMVSDNIAPEGRVAASWGGPSKVGAEGCFAMSRSGFAIATKSASGDSAIAIAAATHAARQLGLLTSAMENRLDSVLHPPVLGGGRPVGTLELQPT